jgi:hypothetical protein
MSKIFNTLLQRALNAGLRDLRTAGLVWVGMGSLVGGFSSAALKVGQIGREPSVEYKNETLETPIRFTYQTTRVAGHAGFGAAVGGITAATAPISIPLYIYWRSDVDQRNRNQK